MEELNALNAAVDQSKSVIERIDKSISGLEEKYYARFAKIRAGFDAGYAEVEERRGDVMMYYRIASDNCKGVSMSSAKAAMVPDYALLRELAEKINKNDYYSDRTAKKMIELCGAYNRYLDQRKEEYDDKTREALKTAERDKQRELARLNAERAEEGNKLRKLFTGEKARALSEAFGNIRGTYALDRGFYSSWKPTDAPRNIPVLIGYERARLSLLPEIKDLPGKIFGEYFDPSSGEVEIPALAALDSAVRMEYDVSSRAAAEEGVLAFLLRMWRISPEGHFKVAVLDRIYYNDHLLGPLAGTGSSVFKKIPGTEKEIEEEIRSLAEFCRKKESKDHFAKKLMPLILILHENEDAALSDRDGNWSYLANNHAKFGIMVLKLVRKSAGTISRALDDGVWDTRVSIGKDGRPYGQSRGGNFPFAWTRLTDPVPEDFIRKLSSASAKTVIGTSFFKRYPMTAPRRSARRSAPSARFAIDDADRPVSFSFGGMGFASYIMGASGSGKSTMLHTIIADLLMSCHPDELELYLVDFKMTEFNKYAGVVPPHVKCVLLDNSEDLLFDLIDRLTAILSAREKEFAARGWSRMEDAPMSVYMPYICVIMDEFAQVAQKLADTIGMDSRNNYALKLENLLTKGRALGFLFIFASQSFVTGVRGLTETARKQIQTRFAMSNTRDEIMETLRITAGQIPASLDKVISNMPPYETIFKQMDEDGKTAVFSKFRNMYIEPEERKSLLRLLKDSFSPSDSLTSEQNRYVEKSPVIIDGITKRSFNSQIAYYRVVTRNGTPDTYYIFPGVPRGIDPARHFTLEEERRENVLVTGGENPDAAAVLFSILRSLQNRNGPSIEIWTRKRYPLYARYRDILKKHFEVVEEPEEVIERIHALYDAVKGKTNTPKAVLIPGFPGLLDEMELLLEDENASDAENRAASPAGGRLSTSEFLEQLKSAGLSKEERQKKIEEFNRGITGSGADTAPTPRKRDPMAELLWLIQRGPSRGVHFIMYFNSFKDIGACHIPRDEFTSKLTFSLSADDSIGLLSSRRASALPEGVCLYTNGIDSFTFRPHDYSQYE